MAIIMILEDDLRKAVQSVNTLDGITASDLDYLTYDTAGLLLQELGIMIGAAMQLDPDGEPESNSNNPPEIN